MDRGGEALVGLVVTGGDPAKALEGAEEVFDEMTPAVHREVASDVAFATRLGRNHREDAALVEFAAKPIIVEALVADQRANGGAIEQSSTPTLSWGNDFGRQTAIKNFRRIATRYNKTDPNFAITIRLVAIALALK